MVAEKKLTNGKLIAYVVIFFAIWSLRELVLQPIIAENLGDVSQTIAGSVIKLSVWTLPSFLFIKHYGNDMWLSLKDMFARPKYFKGAPILLLVFVPLLQAFFTHGEIAVRPGLDPLSLVGPVLFVGITEETVFRGFLLNTLLKKTGTKRAVAINEALFVLIHYPIWISVGVEPTALLVSSVMVFAIGIFFSYSFIRTKNIVVPIVLHMIWNFSTIVFAV